MANDYDQVPGSDNPRRANLFFVAVCCFFLVVIFTGTEVVAWTRQASCDANAPTTRSWGSVIPNHTMTQMQVGFTTFFWNQVNVYDEKKSNTSEIGYWSDVSLLNGWLQKYAYVEKVNGGEEVVLEAYRPWQLFGLSYVLFRCADQGHQFSIEQEYQFFNWGSTTFDIKNASSGVIVAKSKHTLKFGGGLLGFSTFWTATISTPDGKDIATLSQDPPPGFGQFQFLGNNNQKWHTEVFVPGVIPNEVVSFLGAVYDIERAEKKKHSHHR